MSTKWQVMARPAFDNERFNPFNTLLYRPMQAQGIEVIEYQPWLWWLRPKVLHVHWPESPFNHNLWGALAITESLLLALKWHKARGAKIIWTAHNLQAHDRKFPYWENRMWRRFLPLVDGVHCLSSSSQEAVLQKYPELGDRPLAVIPHGHYRGAYKDQISRAQARAKWGIAEDACVLAFVGQIADYKNLPALLQAYSALDQEVHLILAGKPRTHELRQMLEKAQALFPRLHLMLKRIPDAELQYPLRAADAVVLPYREIFNSGSALLALSFDRRVLMPKMSSAQDLKERVGEDWIHTYTGDLQAEDLWQVLQGLPDPLAKVDLASLEWDKLSREMVQFYQTTRSVKPGFPSPGISISTSQSAPIRA